MSIKKVIAELDKLLCSSGVQEVPANYFSASDYARIENISHRTAQQRIKKAISLRPDIFEMKVFKIRTGQSIRPVIHYKIK